MAHSTRLQVRREQSSRLIAPSGVDSPRRGDIPLQVGGIENTSGPVIDDNGRGGNQTSVAGGYYLEFRRGGRKGRIVPKEHNVRIDKCMRNTCKICPIYDTSPIIENRYNKRKTTIINERKCDLSCVTDNIVYLLECSNCRIQYVGETVMKLSERFSDHKSRIRNPKGSKSDTFLVKHFNEGICQGAEFTCRVIQTINKPPRLKNGKMNLETSRYRKKKEDEWMEKLQTIYPYGLNNRHGKNKDQEDEDTVVRQVFTKRRKKRNRRKRYRPKKVFEKGVDVYSSITDGFTGTRNLDKDTLATAISVAHKKIPQMRLSEIRKMGELALEDLRRNNDIPIRMLHIILDLCRSKLDKSQGNVRKTHKRIELPFTVKYLNHGVEMIDLKSIIRKVDVVDSLPLALIDCDKPTVVYKYGPTVRDKIFNYNTVIGDFIPDSTCTCHSSEFLDKDHGHVVTGDLNIIKNSDLKNLIRKGPNFREPRTINWKDTEKSLKEDVSKFISKWSDKVGIPEVCFSEWRNAVFGHLEDKIKRLKKRSKYVKHVSVIKSCSEELKELHEKYVMTPIDKASNNVGFICKKYYLELIKKETESATYEECGDTVNETIDHLRNGSYNVGISVGKEFDSLPSIHALIKMHKNPTKFRFIIGSRRSVMKPAAKTLVKILKLVMNVHRRYCDKILYYTGVQRFWIVENNEKVLKNMEKISKKGNARNVEMFDFSTLYTKISQEDLKNKLKEVVDKAFKGGNNQFIRVSKHSAHWNNSVCDGVFSKERIYLLIDFVIDNSFFRVGDKVFRQIIGIPMGVDPAPQMANLYLYFYEFAYMERLTKEDYKKAKKFNNTTRFIDDLSTLNNDGVLSKEKEHVYPPEMVLNKENANDQEGTFLDISVNVVHNMFISRIYDKRNDFNFEIVNYPDLSGNIPKRQAYGIYTSQILRYARVCSEVSDFDQCVKELTGKLIKKGFERRTLRKVLGKCYLKYGWVATKFSK